MNNQYGHTAFECALQEPASPGFYNWK